MSIKTFLFFLCLILIICTSNVCAQTIDSNIIKKIKGAVEKTVFEYTIPEKINDSTAIYSYTITINVQREKKGQTVSTSINNTEALLFFDGLEKLKEINYLPLMVKRKKMSFSFSTYILVYGSKQEINMIKLDDIPKSIKYLYNILDKKEMYNLGVMLIELDKNIYN